MVSIRDVFLIGVASSLVSGCMNCAPLSEHPTIRSASGQKLCARHHVPLVTARGYTTHKDPEEVSLFHVTGEERVVEVCNPNFIPPDQSLRRHGRFQHHTMVTYCPQCEAAVAANEATPDPFRHPSLWRQISTGVYSHEQ